LAFENASRQPMGLAAAFPRRFYMRGEPCQCWVLGDFCIDSSHRSVGPAVMLQRVCLREVQQRGSFYYDFPSKGMMAIYGRLSISETGSFHRFVRILKIDSLAAGLLPLPIIRWPIKIIGNAFLSIQIHLNNIGHKLELIPLGDRFGEDFRKLDLRMRQYFDLYASRSDAELNWRYRDRPGRRDEILVSYNEGEISGYAVISREKDHALINDIAGLPEDRGIQALLHGLCARLNVRGVERIQAHALQGSILESSLMSAGFRRRECVPFVAVSCADNSRSMDQSHRWFLTQGDRDS